MKKRAVSFNFSSFWNKRSGNGNFIYIPHISHSFSEPWLNINVLNNKAIFPFNSVYFEECRLIFANSAAKNQAILRAISRITVTDITVGVLALTITYFL